MLEFLTSVQFFGATFMRLKIWSAPLKPFLPALSFRIVYGIRTLGADRTSCSMSDATASALTLRLIISQRVSTLRDPPFSRRGIVASQTACFGTRVGENLIL